MEQLGQYSLKINKPGTETQTYIPGTETQTYIPGAETQTYIPGTEIRILTCVSVDPFSPGCGFLSGNLLLQSECLHR